MMARAHVHMYSLLLCLLTKTFVDATAGLCKEEKWITAIVTRTSYRQCLTRGYSCTNGSCLRNITCSTLTYSIKKRGRIAYFCCEGYRQSNTKCIKDTPTVTLDTDCNNTCLCNGTCESPTVGFSYNSTDQVLTNYTLGTAAVGKDDRFMQSYLFLVAAVAIFAAVILVIFWVKVIHSRIRTIISNPQRGIWNTS